MKLSDNYRKSKSASLYKRHRFPPEIIQYAVWLYYRFGLSQRDIENLLAERGIIVSYESFGPGVTSLDRPVREDSNDGIKDLEIRSLLMKFSSTSAVNDTICGERWTRMVKWLMCSFRHVAMVQRQNGSLNDH